ncbi:MAG: ribose-phosphate diphosphokinase [Chloroflexi bacterium]|nr:MAG: ribose-phosphate pyrophosphokinase [Anaerolineaceae bacterium 4572_32.2]RLC77886.1 MAG: ribose-phosphate diphosphokinase [Chloroflexota bacterium]RLC87508.1 MAG: ribose-phosphate diphosphokinase [Chloroflexota bacterium]
MSKIRENIQRNVKLFSGSGCPDLAQEISDYLQVPLSGRKLVQFSNENIFVQLHESVRGQDVFLIQTTSSPVNYNIMEMLIFLDTLKRASPDRITIVIPYLAYARSDKKDMPRVPITARLLADIIGIAGADRYITLDLHAGQIQGFFSIPGDAMTAFSILSKYFYDKQLKDAVVVAADLGFAKKARNLAAELHLPLALVEKRRMAEDTEALTLVGEVKGRNVVIVDEEVNTGGTMVNAVNIVRKYGARDVYLCFAHALLASPAVDRLRDLNITEIVTTNSVPISPEKQLPNLTILSVANLLGEVIKRVHEGRSVGRMFKDLEYFD